jgi:glycogen debranching enzyme
LSSLKQPISLHSKPLVDAYFTRLPKNEKTQGHSQGSLALANNGWIWNADPMQDFAGPQSSSYLRREVICWGDCVKLRYGSGPDDNPYLWQHMKEYTEQTARLFQGIRIDNCHSTPIHVAEYLLDAARSIQPDLYVVAELFTGSEDTDITFVSKLGINSLIREAMQAWDAAELSRLVHRHGGKPIGSMDQALTTEQTTYSKDGKSEEPAVLIPILQGSTPHALFMDCTHDNETPNEKRQPEDTLPNAALVAFSGSAIGSVKGYDDVYPRLLDIVNETRLYDQPKKDANIGITKVKPILQKLHTEMVLDGYIECHIHHEGDYIIVHRQHPELHTGYLLVAHTAFAGRNSKRGSVSPVKLRGTDVDLLFSATLKVESRDDRSDKETLRGLSSKIESLSAPTIRSLSDNKGRYTEIVVPNTFPSGSIMVLKTWIQDNPAESYNLISSCSDNVFSNLSLLDMNVVLHRCEGEERDATGEGVYNIPGHGSLPYAGLEGFVSVLKPVIYENNLGHPFCVHLRDGTWALDYIVDRLNRYLKEYPNLKPLREWFSTRFNVVKGLPDFLIPKYFALIIRTAYLKARAHTLSLMSPLVRQGDRFTQSLALCSVQMYGIVPSSGLHPTEITPSMAAGLPHFTHSYMRTWGRDVFISLRGLFLTTGNYDAAKRHIVSFASSLKHGLIPNLLDAVRYPRYNSRDSAWWFMQAIQDYYNMAPDGKSILQEKVARRFPKDDTFVTPEEGFKYSCTIGEIMQEVFERHAGGLHFREHNAGPQLDSQMKEEGFNIDIDVDWETGVIIGGNRLNCGTWQDKMGESAKAGNKGLPATPRDGAPIEITGLLKSALRWVVELHERGEFEWTGVKDQEGKVRSYKYWNDTLQKNFERVYYVPLGKLSFC